MPTDLDADRNHPNRSSLQVSPKICCLDVGEAPALVDARTRGDEQIVEEPLEGIVCEDSFQVLPLQLLEEVILEVVLSQTLGGKAGLGVFVSHDVRFSFDEGLDVGAEVHPFHDTRDAVVL